MPTTIIDVRELPSRFDEVVSLAAMGTDIIVAERGVPCARLVPIASGQTRVAGLDPGAIQTSDDFDEPLPEELWLVDSPDGGLEEEIPMRPEELMELIRARPFHPLRIHMTDGQTYDIRHPEAVFVLRSRVDIAMRPDPVTGVIDRVEHCSLLHIVRVEELQPDPQNN